MSADKGHPIRGRLNAWFLAFAEDAMHEEYGDRKVSMFGPVPDAVIELGPGSGANFRYYPRGTRVIAVEPNPMMHRRMNAQAQRHGIQIDLRHAGAEGMEVETASADLVVSTLVLCSVRDPQRVVSEVKRVLKPGGRFAFLEHVAAPAGTGFVGSRTGSTGHGTGWAKAAISPGPRTIGTRSTVTGTRPPCRMRSALPFEARQAFSASGCAPRMLM